MSRQEQMDSPAASSDDAEGEDVFLTPPTWGSDDEDAGPSSPTTAKVLNQQLRREIADLKAEVEVLRARALKWKLKFGLSILHAKSARLDIIGEEDGIDDALAAEREVVKREIEEVEVEVDEAEERASKKPRTD
ncbi:hypothetical protein TWF694_005253 [Orbilia ellipsospora]|uniref:Uncharacterized protein n=1 Tax=Orbilia ellipsospora TaxID=2528407 RepID=A0AAV9WSQ3_9PEZI